MFVVLVNIGDEITLGLMLIILFPIIPLCPVKKIRVSQCGHDIVTRLVSTSVRKYHENSRGLFRLFDNQLAEAGH